MADNEKRSRQRDPRRPAGIRDVAAKAGVSVATVSRSFNAPDSVRDVLREKVLKAAREAGYVPNAAARELVSTRSYRIGAVIPTIAHSIFAEFIDSLTRTLTAEGYSLLLSTYGFESVREADAIRSMLAAGVEGIMLSGLDHDAKALEIAEARGVVCVMTSILDRSGRWPSVGYDNARAGRMIAEHVAGLGHRRVAILAGNVSKNDRARLRVEGMTAGLAAAGVVPGPIVERPLELAAGRDGMAEILATAPEVTAVLCGNDVLAAGALFEAQSRGIRVPDQLSIAGIEGSDIAGVTEPRLTTVRAPVGRMGEAAAREFIRRLGDRSLPVEPVELPLTMVQAGSTGPVPG